MNNALGKIILPIISVALIGLGGAILDFQSVKADVNSYKELVDYRFKTIVDGIEDIKERLKEIESKLTH